jgi:undecaprenyl-diphosphatase
VGGLLVGLDRPTATAFSFYLAIPTLGGATLYSLVKNLDTLQARGNLVALAIGTLAAFITAAFAIRWMLGYVAHHDFRVFAVYRIVAGLLILLVFWP